MHPSLRSCVVVVLGDSVWQPLTRAVIRAMMIPFNKSPVRFAVVETIESGISTLVNPPASLAPSVEEVWQDACALHVALGLAKPRVSRNQDPVSPAQFLASQQRATEHARATRCL